MVTVELTRREADALDEAARLGDKEDVEELRTATDKLWMAADAQQHGPATRRHMEDSLRFIAGDLR